MVTWTSRWRTPRCCGAAHARWPRKGWRRRCRRSPSALAGVGPCPSRVASAKAIRAELNAARLVEAAAASAEAERERAQEAQQQPAQPARQPEPAGPQSQEEDGMSEPLPVQSPVSE